MRLIGRESLATGQNLPPEPPDWNGELNMIPAIDMWQDRGSGRMMWVGQHEREVNMSARFESFRDRFPAYREGVYVNHAAISPVCDLAWDAADNYLHMRSSLPVDIYPDIEQVRQQFVGNIAALIGARASEAIALVQNTSHGLNVVASGIKWAHGDRILLVRNEFPANVYPFLNLESQGVIIDWVDPDENGCVTADMVAAALKSRTRLFSISHVQFLSGFKADLHEIGRVCKEKDIIFVVDGIQGVGVSELNVEKDGIDALACGGHKWLMWPMGVAFLYLSPALLEQLRPVHAGWLSVRNAWDLFDYRLDFVDSAGRFELGTMNWMGISMAAPMLAAFLDLGISEIERRVLSLTGRLIDGLSDQGLEVVTPRENRERAGIVSIRLDEADRVLQELVDRDIFAAVREGVLRFSPHMTNNEADIDQIVTVMDAGIQEGWICRSL